MAETGPRRRVRVITDPVKYRRHQRRKLLRRAFRLLLLLLVVGALGVVIWFLLGQVSRVP